MAKYVDGHKYVSGAYIVSSLSVIQSIMHLVEATLKVFKSGRQASPIKLPNYKHVWAQYRGKW